MPDNELIPWADMKLTDAELQEILRLADESKDDVPDAWWIDD